MTTEQAADSLATLLTSTADECRTTKAPTTKPVLRAIDDLRAALDSLQARTTGGGES